MPELARHRVCLQESSDVLEPCNGQAISDSQPVLVALLVNGAMSCPTTSRSTAPGLTVGRKASRLTDKTKGRDRRQPIKPLCRLRHHAQLAMQRAHDDIATISTILNQGRHAQACLLLRRIECSRH